MISRRTFSLGLSACTLTACTAHNGGSASSNLAPGYKPTDSDEAGLWAAMSRVEDKLKTSSTVIRDPALTEFLHDLTCRLAGSHCSDIRVYVVRTPMFNASMAPNGMLQLWSGALLRCRSESQLAAIIGHEVSHYLRHHGVDSWRDSRVKADFIAFLSLGLAAAGAPPGVDALASLAMLSSVYSYSRDNEREADAMGLDLLVQAGYDPMAAAQVWEQLISESKAGGTDLDRDFFFASHPAAEERLQTLRGLAERRTQRAGPVRDDLDRVLLPLRHMLLTDELRQGQFKRTEFLINDRLPTDACPGELLFFKGELYRLRDEQDDVKRALESYATAVDKNGCPPEAYRSMGVLYRKSGDRDAAREAFGRYLKLRPDATDREIIRVYMESKS